MEIQEFQHFNKTFMLQVVPNKVLLRDHNFQIMSAIPVDNHIRWQVSGYLKWNTKQCCTACCDVCSSCPVMFEPTFSSHTPLLQLFVCRAMNGQLDVPRVFYALALLSLPRRSMSSFVQGRCIMLTVTSTACLLFCKSEMYLIPGICPTIQYTTSAGCGCLWL